jgi:hypothetical protein
LAQRSHPTAVSRSTGHRSAPYDCATEHIDIRPQIVAPAAHEWWTRRAALGLGIACVGSGAVVLAHASLLETPMGAIALFMYEQRCGAHSAAHDPLGTLHDWAIAEGVAFGAQGAAIGVILTGFLLAAYAAH